MKCTNCGADNPGSSKFCSECGSQLVTTSNDGSDLQETVHPISMDQQDVQQLDQTPNSKKENATPSDAKRKMIISLMIVLALIATFSGMILNSCSKKGMIGGTFKESTDLEVIASAIDTRESYNDPISLVKNISDKVIQNYTLAYIGYDANGNFVNISSQPNKFNYGTMTYQSVNLLPDEENDYVTLHRPYFQTNLVSSVAEKIKYVKATPYEIDFMDGSQWTATNIESWVAQNKDNFTVEEYNNTIDSYITQAKEAENNGICVVTSSLLSKSNYKDIQLIFENRSDQTIKNAEFIICGFDENAYPVQWGFSNTGISINSDILSVEGINLQPDYECTYTQQLFDAQDMAVAKVIPYSVEFMDGSTWQNPYSFQWTLYNETYR